MNGFLKETEEINYVKYYLNKYGNTCLNYNSVERFGVKGIKEALLELGYDCTVELYSDICPDTIYDFEYDKNRRVRVAYPLLPIVVLRWKDFSSTK